MSGRIMELEVENKFFRQKLNELSSLPLSPSSTLTPINPFVIEILLLLLLLLVLLLLLLILFLLLLLLLLFYYYRLFIKNNQYNIYYDH